MWPQGGIQEPFGDKLRRVIIRLYVYCMFAKMYLIVLIVQ